MEVNRKWGLCFFTTVNENSFKVEVKEAKQVVLPKYEDSADEEEGEVLESDSEYTEGSDSDEE